MTMEGIVKSFVQQKKFGFIEGSDSQSYFFHVSDVMWRVSSVPVGAHVSFDPTPTKKGMRAYAVKILEEGKAKTYERMENFRTFKKPVKGWEVIDGGGWTLSVTDRSLDKAKSEVERYAKHLGANALIDFNYKRSTRSRGTGGSGVYHFSVHTFSGTPAILARPALDGDDPEQYRGVMNAVCQPIAKRQRWTKIISYALMVPTVFIAIVVGLMAYSGVIFPLWAVAPIAILIFLGKIANPSMRIRRKKSP